MAKLIKLVREKGPGFAQYLYELNRPKVMKFCTQYLPIEYGPPTPSEFREIGRRINNIVTRAKNGTYTELTLHEVIKNTLAFTEVVCWFFIGECIGRRHLTGYNYPLKKRGPFEIAVDNPDKF